MKKLLTFIAAGILVSSAGAQQISSPEETVRRVAGYIMHHTSYQFINARTNETFESTANLTPDSAVKAKSNYNRWEYSNGVLAVGMVHLSSVLKDKQYADYAERNFNFVFSNLPYFEKLYQQKIKAEWASLLGMQNLDACGAMAAGLSDVNEFAKKKVYNDYLEKAADYISHKQMRFPDRTLSRPIPREMTLWADDLYMSVPFLARMGKRTDNNAYLDDAIRQVENFNRYLYDTATGLYFHCYYDDTKTNGVARWARCNGWLAMAQVELLNNLPANHPKRKELIGLLLRQIVGLSRYQDATGLWHQLLDRPDTYLETSATAMFVYTVARAVNEGWIPKTYATIAKDGWEGLAAKIQPDGQVEDVCIGTGIADNIRFYMTRPKRLNDTHALGAVLLAGAEMIRYNAGNGR